MLAVILGLSVASPNPPQTVVGVSSSASMTASGDLRQIARSQPEVPDWTPTPQVGLSVVSDGLDGYTLADLRLANTHFKPSLVPWALETSYCESRNEDGLVGSSGERGRWQIHPLWVLNDWTPEVQEVHRRIRRLGYEPTVANLAIPEVNATVANYIVTEFGPSLWTTGKGCEAW